MSNNIRVRFAPSPTGPLHIGGLRTALFNYLYAKKNNGKFILRIEDTDTNRYIKNSEEHIFNSLKWAGIEVDEGPNVGNAGYRQSERKKLYKNKISELIKTGHAYYAFDKVDELEAYRSEHTKRGEAFVYGPKNRKNLKNSISLSDSEVESILSSEKEYVVRFKTPENSRIICNDLLKGTVKVDSNTMDDKVLYKSDGNPTYHFANVVDDFDMRITHVIRGEEWLPSLPLHTLIYDAFKWKKPCFIHLPLILKPEGKGKLSKRDGDKFGFPVLPISWVSGNQENKGFKECGYLPEATLNFLAMLGWGPGTDQEFFTKERLIKTFSLSGLNKSSARFDPKKIAWFNQKHIQGLENSVLKKLLVEDLDNENIKFHKNKLDQIIRLIKPRLSLTTDVFKTSKFFFQDPLGFDQKDLEKFKSIETAKLLKSILSVFESTADRSSIDLKKEIEKTALKHSTGFGKVMKLLRLAIVGSFTGPDLFETIQIIEIKVVTRRLSFLLNSLSI